MASLTKLYDAVVITPYRAFSRVTHILLLYKLQRQRLVDV